MAVLHQFVFAVAFNINEEEVLPVLAFRRSALDLAHAQFQPVKRFDRSVQSADSILDAEHQGCLVITGLRATCVRDDQKSSGIIRAVLDRPLEDLQPIDLSGHRAGQSRRVRLFRSEFSGFRRARDFNPFEVMGAGLQPFPALAENLGVRIDLGDLVFRCVRQEDCFRSEAGFARIFLAPSP